MASNLSAKSFGQFLASDVERGEEYLASQRVSIVEIGREGAHAIADGSHGQQYDLCLDFSFLDEDELGVFCNCPHFGKGFFCKHLWAMLRMADDYLPPLRKSTGNLNLEVCSPAEVAVGQRINERSSHEEGRGITKRDVSTRRSVPVPLGVAAGGNPSKTEDTKNGDWRNMLSQLNTLFDSGPGAGFRDTLRRQIPTEEHQIWFALALSDLAEDDYFIVHAYLAKKDRNGKWTTPRKTRAQTISDQADEATSRIFALLELEDENEYWYHDSDTILRLPNELIQETLELLCKSGRFVWMHDNDADWTDARPLVFDQEGRWHFALQIAKHSRRLIARPTLYRTTSDGRRENRDIYQTLGVCDS